MVRINPNRSAREEPRKKWRNKKKVQILLIELENLVQIPSSVHAGPSIQAFNTESLNP